MQFSEGAQCSSRLPYELSSWGSAGEISLLEGENLYVRLLLLTYLFQRISSVLHMWAGPSRICCRPAEKGVFFDKIEVHVYFSMCFIFVTDTRSNQNWLNLKSLLPLITISSTNLSNKILQNLRTITVWKACFNTEFHQIMKRCWYSLIFWKMGRPQINHYTI